jgi:FAD/FMN-containing dehydrogenase/Fe-S oxidoreductase
MDPEQVRIEEDLRGIISGEVVCDDVGRSLYATDGSLFEERPLAVVRPRSTEDVAATIRWAAEQGVSVHPRGGGTSLCGGPLGPGIVIDCARFMRRILAVREHSVRVQPGMVAAQFDAFLARRRRVFGPDPANAAVSTIGGMIGRDASGSRFLRHGSVRRWVESLEVVLADGTVVELGPTAAEPPAPAEPAGGIAPATSDRVATLAASVATLLARGRGVIARGQPPTRATHGGYRLHDLERDGLVDLHRLVCGAEGTLGVVTAATLRTAAFDQATAVGLLLFDSLESAAEAAVRLLALEPSACDLFDRRHLALARQARPSFDLLIPPVAEAGLLVEFTADEPAECNAKLEQALASMRRGRRGCIDIRRAEDGHDAAFFWDLSRNVVSMLHGVRAALRPVPFLEDVVVPPATLPQFLGRLQAVLRQQHATAMIFSHAGHGELHVRPHANPRSPGERARLEALAEAVYAEVAAVGGSIGAELGLGLSRTPFFSRLFPELAELFVEVKRIFDPAGILNPGRVVPEASREVPFRPPLGATPDDSADPGSDGGVEPPPPRDEGPQLVTLTTWSRDRLVVEVDACNGCGGCRSVAATTRMCPRFRENPAEEASPRAKADVMAGLLAGQLDPKSISSEAVRAVADTCFNCHRCRSDCAAGVDIPAIVMELKAAHYAANSTRLAPWLLTRIDSLSAAAGRVRPLANWALANPQARWVMEKTLGIARGRKLPAVSGTSFLRWAAKRGLTRPSRRSGPRVLYFLDTYARRHDPLLGQAFVSVLERNGIGVFIDPRQVASGMPLVSEGDLDGARRLARMNVRVLAEAVRLGYRIVCTEPSAVTCITHHYPLLLDDEELPRVAAATCDAATYLWELHREGRLRLDFRPVPARILYHAGCHEQIGGGLPPAENLLRLVPGLALEAADRGCSGMAGTFGLAREHYRASLRMGLPLVNGMRAAGIEAGATGCSACRIQMEQGTTKPAVHPVKILAKAYGLLEGPGTHGLDSLLTATSGRLTTT